MAFFLQIIINGILTGGVYALMALAIVIIYKSSSVFNFAHGSLVALSSFLFWQLIVGWHLPLLAAIPLLLVFIVVLSYAIQRFILQPLTGQPLMATIMATIALGELFSGTVVLFWPGPGRVMPELIFKSELHLSSIVLSSEDIVNFVICAVCFLIFNLFFKKTRIGLAMRGTAEDHVLAQSEGIRVRRIFIVSWLVALVVITIGGVLMSSLYGVSFVTLNALGMKALAVVILGGMESVAGALIGGLIIGVMESLGSGYLDPLLGGGFSEVAPYIVLLIALIIRPYGLFGYERIERV